MSVLGYETRQDQAALAGAEWKAGYNGVPPGNPFLDLSIGLAESLNLPVTFNGVEHLLNSTAGTLRVIEGLLPPGYQTMDHGQILRSEDGELLTTILCTTFADVTAEDFTSAFISSLR